MLAAPWNELGQLSRFLRKIAANLHAQACARRRSAIQQHNQRDRNGRHRAPRLDRASALLEADCAELRDLQRGVA